MLIFKTVSALQNKLNKLRNEGKTIGFFPTMGALHLGHISLLHLAKKQCDISVCSIFVNPTQFNESSDLKKYPRTLSEDISHLTNNKNDILFIPSIKEVYPNGSGYYHNFDVGQITTVLEGKFRPGHFDGVIQVVHRLCEIVEPHTIFMGQKDYQQAAVIRKMLQLSDFETSLVVAPIIRSENGLALSSRNNRLSEESLLIAPRIYKTLQYIKNNFSGFESDILIDNALEILGKDFKVEYLSIVDTENLLPLKNNSQHAIVLIAAWLDGIRLIDNLILK